MDESEEFLARLREQQMNDSYNWNRLAMFLNDMQMEGEELFSIRFITDNQIAIEATSRPDCITIILD